MKRVGVDIGGTFTDLVVLDEITGAVERTKTLTTPRSPEDGFLQAVADRQIKLDDVAHFLHGTTLVTNLIIERTGAKVGLITTKGFRDVLEIQRSYRDELYNLQWDKPKALVPRHLRLTIDERVDAHGAVLRAADVAETRAVVQRLLDLGVEAIAICLLNAYANPVNEMALARVVREMAPNIALSLSSEVDPRIREYERVSTTTLNAYAMPRMHRYMSRLDQALQRNEGIKYMHSGGGVIPSATAERFPIQLLYSGPAAGVLAGRFLAATLGVPNVCTIDMGGTSLDACLIRDGEPDSRDTIEVEWGIPARTQSIDIHSIGAGGGSIVWFDAGGALRIGPESAGSDPGPACYGRGGIKPTVTDANLVLGILNPDGLLGGKLRLDRAKAEAALRPIADKFGVSVEEAATGVYRIVTASVAEAIREVTVKRGTDPRDFALVAFGGAGGQHAAEVAREMEMKSVIFPRNASTFSAFGLLTADLKNSVAKSLMIALSRASAAKVEEDYRELEGDARRFLDNDETALERVYVDRWADVRYIGQSHEVSVPVRPEHLDLDTIYADFERLHERFYGTKLEDAAEIVNIRVTVTGQVPRLKATPFRPDEVRTAPTGERQTAFSKESAPVFWRDGLPPGWRHEGACLIEEVDSVIYIPGGSVEIDEYGSVRLGWGAA
jgi:N-methylhydantoinase A